MKRLILFISFIGLILSLFSQNVGINATGSNPDPSAMLDVQGTTKGFLLPRLTTAQRDAIPNPATGLQIYNTSDSVFNYYDGVRWIASQSSWERKRRLEFDISTTKDSVVDAQNLTFASSFVINPAPISNRAGQSFTTVRSGWLTQIQVNILPSRPMSAYTFQLFEEMLVALPPIQQTSGTFPGGQSGWVSFDIIPKRRVEAGETYTFMIQETSGPPYFWEVSGGNPYPGGQVLAGLSGNPQSQLDMVFRTWVIPDPIPLAVNPVNGNTEIGNGAIHILPNGNVGIGTSSPDQTLHLVGGFRYEDGNEAAGYVLTSDANGVASWQAPVDDQMLSFTSPNLSISGGNSVDLSGIDDQTLSFTSPNLSISGGNSVNLSNIQDNLGNHTATQSLRMGDNAIYLRGGTDVNHGLRYAGPSSQFANHNPDGPVLFGFWGGMLGTTSGGEKGVLYWNSNGNVGIGVSNPTRGKLEIIGGVQNTLSYGYLNILGNIGTATATTLYSLYADQRIAAVEFNAFSDARIKYIQGVSDSETDLATLMQIEITDYRMKDSIAKGTDSYKKVIAQQVAEVYPQAVTANLTDVVPDIYQRAEVQDGWIMLATDLKPGERVKLITEKSAEVYEVTAVEMDRFQVFGLAVPEPVEGPLSSTSSETGKVTLFVFGREVDDFHTVDYEAISMLNVSATQAQQRIIEAQQIEIEEQQTEIEELKRKNQRMEESFEARLQALEDQASTTRLTSSSKK